MPLPARDPAPPTRSSSTMPERLASLEGQAVRSRRKTAGLDPESGPPLGLALSGGGIRSATFALGVLQAFARAKLLRRFDYLSTVSGGGYVGSFLGRLFSRSPEELRKALSPPPRAEEVASTPAADLVERILTDPTSKPLSFLRENGRYLSPNGSGDLVLAGAVALRNWAAVHVVLGTFLLTFFLLAQAVRLLALYLSTGVGGFASGIVAAGWFTLPALSGLFVVVPLGWAYWLGQPKSQRGWRSLYPEAGGIAVLVAALALVLLDQAQPAALPRSCRPILLTVGGIAFVALAALRVARLPGRRPPPGGDAPASAESDTKRDRSRNNRLSRWLATACIFSLATLAFAVVDLVGLKLFRVLTDVQWDPIELLRSWTSATATAGLGGLLVFGRKLAAFLAGKANGARLSLSAEVVASLAALALGAFLLVGHSVLSWGFVKDWHEQQPSFYVLFRCALAVGILASVLFGLTLPFLNQSSLQALYTARLARAYMGASNPARWAEAGMNVTEPIGGDGTRMNSYRPDERGGPLHIVNVTLNETILGRSQLEQRDRKGLGMAIGPFATSVGRRAHAFRGEETVDSAPLQPADPQKGEYAIFCASPGCETIPAEPLTLETWIAVSGAAVSTGLGARTSLGLSFLCGFFNVRLGYWWDSGMDPSDRPRAVSPSGLGRVRASLEALLPVQMHLVDELLATFRGPNARRWYLTDGGHFENTAAYELIRRRLPLIVLCDDGADPEYRFGDVANLVRKARLDFQTEIAFLDESELSSGAFGPLVGPLEDLRRDNPGRLSRRCAALARVGYPDGTEGRLVLLKPTVTGRESHDVLEYHRTHPDFPQEPTGDQFFDEAQWESYRKLGELVGTGMAPVIAKLLYEDLAAAGGEA